MQNQGQPSPQNITAQNAMAANAKYQQESASELAQSPGQISQLLYANAKAGFEFGNMGRNVTANNANANARYEFGNISNNAAMANANVNQNSELNQSNGQISQTLARQSR
jgi:hypothetical protein